MVDRSTTSWVAPNRHATQGMDYHSLNMQWRRLDLSLTVTLL